MQLVNIGKIEYWLLIIFLWGSVFTYLAIFGFRIWKEKKSETILKSIKNYKSINPVVRFLINSFISLTVLLFLTLIVFRPVLGTEKTESSTKNLDIAFLVDISLSMNVKDYEKPDKTRLDGAKEILAQIVEDTPGNRYSLISFHSKAEVEMPLTFDKTTTLTGIDTLHIIDSFATNGTSMAQGLLQAKDRLTSEDDSFGKNRKKIVILVTDGEQVGKESLDLNDTIDELKKNNIRVYTLGVGTKEGDKIPEYKFLNGDESFVRYQGEYAISKLDENNMKEIASIGEGKYYHGTPDFDSNSLILELENSSQYVDIGSGEAIFKDSYFIFTPLILILILILHIEPYNFILELRRRK